MKRFWNQAEAVAEDGIRRSSVSPRSAASFRRPASAQDGVHVTYDMTRLQRFAQHDGGTEQVAAVMATADRHANDAHLWAVVAEIVRRSHRNALSNPHAQTKSVSSMQDLLDEPYFSDP